MAKKMTLEQRADAAAIKAGYRVNDYGFIVFPNGYIAGWRARGRAGATTKAERAVIEAAIEWRRGETASDYFILARLIDALLKARSAK
jgi:hypothetical protein